MDDFAVYIKELRKLNIGWWNGSETKMVTILQAAGKDEARLALIKAVGDTCRECRAWQKRGNLTQPSMSLPGKFNEEGETDLFFHKSFIDFHIIDRAIRLRDGCEIPNKETRTLLNAYMNCWVQRDGAFKVLYTDGESGLVASKEAQDEMKRLGTELRPRAKGQHAQLAESRQSMLRHVMHLTEEELKRHNHTIPFTRLYGEDLFVVNAFSFYNGVSPYNAHTRRQPAFLPDLENINHEPEGVPDGNREARIREAAIAAITQSTAVSKTNRALKARILLMERDSSWEI